MRHEHLLFTIPAHQGKFIASRSKESILKEVKQIIDMPDFKGYLSDLPFAKTTTCGEKEGYEYVAECTGSESGLPQAMELVRKKGTIILKSTYAGKVSLDMSMAAVNELTIVGSRCGPFEPALRLLKDKKIHLPEIELYDLKDFEKAFASPAFKSGFAFID